MVKDVCYLDREKEPTNVHPVDGYMLQISCPASSQLSFIYGSLIGNWLLSKSISIVQDFSLLNQTPQKDVR